MFEDILELEGLIPTIVLYVVVGIMMWYLLMKKPFFDWATKIGFYIVLLPITYVIVNHYRNKEW